MNKLIIALFLPSFLMAQDAFKMQKKTVASTLSTTLDINPLIKGTLQVPESNDAVPLVIMITGSGPNDRNGNSMMTRNDSHKQLAAALLENSIATYRYDKRSFTLVKERKPTDDISFDDFVLDAQAVVTHFATDDRFDKLFIAGHSQGSLVGMLALDESVDGFISLAGAADSIDKVIIEQLAAQAPGLDKQAAVIFEKMKKQDSLVSNVSPVLMSIAGPGIQPFMKSWMVYEPANLIASIEQPIMIVNGTRDRQVSVAQAKKLHAAQPSSQLVIIEGMDHLFKKVSDDDVMAAKSYVDPSFPVHEELIDAMVKFIKSE